jgi:hypothetical protein
MEKINSGPDYEYLKAKKGVQIDYLRKKGPFKGFCYQKK